MQLAKAVLIIIARAGNTYAQCLVQSVSEMFQDKKKSTATTIKPTKPIHTTMGVSSGSTAR